MAISYYMPEIVTNEFRALMFTKFCGYERIQVDIEYRGLCHDYNIIIRSLLLPFKQYLYFDADMIKNASFRRSQYYYQLGLNWADPVC